MFFIDVTEPITLLLLLLATILLIFLGKELKKPFITALPLAAYLILALMHSIQLGFDGLEQYRNVIFGCIAYDCIMIFVTFFSYLWVDDIASKFYKKKSIDNSLDWFWNNV